MKKAMPKTCPDTCPTCGADLKRQGYPFAHQHDWTGEECEFRWEPAGSLDRDYEE